MTSQTLHVQLSDEAAGRLNGSLNAAGQTLRDWLLKAFEQEIEPSLAHASLFSTSIQVASDVPLLLEAYTRITGSTSTELIEAWLSQPAAEAGAADEDRVSTVAANEPADTLSGETLGKLAQVIDMGETLLEAFASDARNKLGGSYPESERVTQATSDLFRALRILLGLNEIDGNSSVVNGSKDESEVQKS
jgi:hypothetical protein